MRYALAYLVCFQIMVNHIHIAHSQQLIDCGINLYIQKEQLILLDEEGHPSLFAPIMIATLSTCAQLERDNISFRLQSGRKRYIEKGGKLGRKVVSVKNAIIAIILLNLRSFQRKGLCNSGLKAKNTTFAYQYFLSC